eukprot:8465803-Pyramimonas_sp.AAC.2
MLYARGDRAWGQGDGPYVGMLPAVVHDRKRKRNAHAPTLLVRTAQHRLLDLFVDSSACSSIPRLVQRFLSLYIDSSASSSIPRLAYQLLGLFIDSLSCSSIRRLVHRFLGLFVDSSA